METDTKLEYISITNYGSSLLIRNISPYYEYGAEVPIYSVDDANSLIELLQNFVYLKGLKK